MATKDRKSIQEGRDRQIDILFRNAVEHALANDFKQAEICLRCIVKIIGPRQASDSAQNVIAKMMLGIVLKKQGRIAEARKAMSEVLGSKTLPKKIEAMVQFFLDILESPPLEEE